MRSAITKQVEGEISTAESDIRSREAEFRELQSTDSRAEKRQMWMQSISGQNAPGAIDSMTPGALGARSNALGSSAGREMRGVLSGQQQPPQPRMGLSGMRSPMTSSKPLAPQSNVPLARPVKTPLGSGAAPSLPQPVQKLVRAPLQPVTSPVAETQIEQTVESAEEQSVADESQEDEIVSTLRPITSVLESLGAPSTAKTATLTPKPVQLIPKKARGAPPQSNRGEKPQTTDDTVLKPVQKLTPLKLTPPNQQVAEEEEDETE